MLADHFAENVEIVIATILRVFLVILYRYIASALPFVLCPPRYMIKLLEIVMVSNFRRVQRTSMRGFIMIVLKNDQDGSLQSKTSFAIGKIGFGLVKFKS